MLCDYSEDYSISCLTALLEHFDLNTANHYRPVQDLFLLSHYTFIHLCTMTEPGAEPSADACWSLSIIAFICIGSVLHTDECNYGLANWFG